MAMKEAKHQEEMELKKKEAILSFRSTNTSLRNRDVTLFKGDMGESGKHFFHTVRR